MCQSSGVVSSIRHVVAGTSPETSLQNNLLRASGGGNSKSCWDGLRGDAPVLPQHGLNPSLTW